MKPRSSATLLAILVAVASVGATPDGYNRFYEYESQITTGIPVKDSTYSVLKLQTKLVAHVKENDWTFHFTDVSFFKDPLVLRDANVIVPKTTFMNDHKLTETQEKQLKLPFRINYKNGVVSDLHFFDEDKPWSENIKRAVVNLFQLNIRSENPSENANQEDMFITNQEELFDGKCEVDYTINKFSKTKSEVTKAINYAKCEKRFDIRYGHRFVSSCEHCGSRGDARPDVQTIMTYKITGNQTNFSIDDVELKSQYLDFSLTKDRHVLETHVYSKLTNVLQKASTKSTDQTPTKRAALGYFADAEMARERFWATGDADERKRAFPTLVMSEDHQKTVDQLLDSLFDRNSQLRVQPDAPTKFANFVEDLRKMTQDELTGYKENICDMSVGVKAKKCNEIYLNGLVLAGTIPSLEVFEKLVNATGKSKVTTLEKAAQLLYALPIASRTPSKKTIDLVLRMGDQSPVLQQSALLSAGALMNVLCGANQERWALELDGSTKCHQNLKKTFIAELKSRFGAANSTQQRVLVLKAIGNAGIDLSIEELGKIANDRSQGQIVRVTAIDGMRFLRDQVPRKVLSQLLPLFKNRAELVEVRMSAAYQIIHSQPPRHIVNELAKEAVSNPNGQLRGYLVNLLMFKSLSQVPCEQTLASDVKAAFTEFPKIATESFAASVAAYLETQDIGAFYELMATFSNDSSLPQSMSTTFGSLLGGEWNRNAFEYGFRQQDFENMFRDMFIRGEPDDDQKRPVAKLMRKLLDDTKIVARGSLTKIKDSLGVFYARYRNLDLGMHMIDGASVPKLDENFYQSLAFSLLLGKKFEKGLHSYAYEHSRTLATTAGLPLVITQKTPVVGHSSVDLSLKISPNKELHAKGFVSVAGSNICEMQLGMPELQMGARAMHLGRLAIPLSLAAGVDSEGGMFLRVGLPESEEQLVQLETRPVYFMHTFREGGFSIYRGGEVAPIVEQNLRTFDKSSSVGGLRLGASGSYDVNLFEKPSAFLFGRNKLAIGVEPHKDAAQQILFTLTKEQRARLRFDPTLVEKFKNDKFGVENIKGDETTEERQARHSHMTTYYKELADSFRDLPGRSVITITALGGKHPINATIEIAAESKMPQLLDVVYRREPSNDDDSGCKWHLRAHQIKPKINSLKEFNEEKHRELHAHAQLEWGTVTGNGADGEVLITVHGTRTQEMQQVCEEVSKNSKFDELSQIEKCARINKVTTQIDHRGVSRPLSKFIEHLYALARLRHTFDAEVTPIPRHDGKILLEFENLARDGHHVNMTIETPDERFSVAVEMPWDMNRLSTLYEKQGLGTLATCQVDSNNVRTFDSKRYRVPLTACYSVLAKDCSANPSNAILMRNARDNSTEKQMRVLFYENVYDFQLVDGAIQTLVNGKVEESVKKRLKNVIEMDFPRFLVRFDGFRATIRSNKNAQNTQCGLCGHFDGVRDNEFRQADNVETDDLFEFHRSWTWLDGECKTGDTFSDNSLYGLDADEDDDAYGFMD